PQFDQLDKPGRGDRQCDGGGDTGHLRGEGLIAVGEAGADLAAAVLLGARPATAEMAARAGLAKTLRGVCGVPPGQPAQSWPATSPAEQWPRGWRTHQRGWAEQQDMAKQTFRVYQTITGRHIPMSNSARPRRNCSRGCSRNTIPGSSGRTSRPGGMRNSTKPASAPGPRCIVSVRIWKLAWGFTG